MTDSPKWNCITNNCSHNNEILQNPLKFVDHNDTFDRFLTCNDHIETTVSSVSQAYGFVICNSRDIRHS